jgi:hypothetical protein
MFARSVMLVTLAAAPVFAQSRATPSATAQLRKSWEQVRDYIMDAAVEVPESTYAFRPTPEV